MPDDVLLAHLAADGGVMRSVLLAAPEATVTHCPGWSVGDLIRHHGDVQRWATTIVETGRPAEGGHVGLDDLSALARWYDDGASRLIDALAAADPARPCWTFGRPPGEAWFWTRRQALEAAIHRWDAQTAVGAADGFTAEVAAAGITEVVDDFLPRQIALGRTAALSASVVFRASDLDRRWTLPGIASSPRPAELTGPAAALFLLLWRRIDLGDPATPSPGHRRCGASSPPLGSRPDLGGATTPTMGHGL
ncbi:MAG: maleylpyruvate isomerase family mycothiol-dependent enzyme [Acidimicrobiia bacterium]|nr:maleylpyruvate isomerase family mycothiol-dependent enzyme [Acidimicrobiia bacterium]